MPTDKQSTRNERKRDISRYCYLFLVSMLIGITSPRLFAAAPIIEYFYIPLPEDQVLTALDRIESSANSPINSFVSIVVAANNTVIYYDHWENGYEADLANPTSVLGSGGTTEIWGDGILSNGVAPGDDGDDLLDAGQVIVLENQVTIPDVDNDNYDGRDKIGATKIISMTRAAWASGSGTLLAGAIEVYPTFTWGTEFVFPIGSNTASSNNMFQYTGLAVMAAEDNTVINIDRDADGTDDFTTTINEGESYHWHDATGTNSLQEGATLSASKPVQVDLITGDVGATYEARWYMMFPRNQWSDSYFSPVGTPGGAPTATFIYNPDFTNSITVTIDEESTASTSIVVPAETTVRHQIGNGHGVHYYTAGNEPFFAVAAVDASTGGANLTHDWGFTLIPEGQLKPQAQVGWGPGRDKDSGTNPSENGSPVWLTTTTTTSVDVCVDYDGDNAGSLTDSNGFNYDLLLTMGANEGRTVYDPDGDQTGMTAYVCDGSDALVALAWGQDPNTASVGAPAIDVGTTVPGTPNFIAGKGAALKIDLNANTEYDLGDTVTYTIVVQNVSRVPIGANIINLIDTLPAEATYVANSTSYSHYQFIADTTTGPISIADDAPTAFPLDASGYDIPVILGGLDEFTITFDAVITSMPGSGNDIVNSLIATDADIVFSPTATITVNDPATISNFVWNDLNRNGIQDGGESGINGVTVNLLTSAGAPTGMSTTTAGGGLYSIGNIPAGSYIVEFVLPGNTVFTTQDSGGDDALDSDASTSNGRTAVIALAAGDNNVDIDAGMIQVGSVGDRVWIDTNGDGVQDAGETTGLSGVDLWVDLDNNGVQDGGEPSGTTNGSGIYSITNVPVGNWNVRIDTSSVPAGYVATTASLVAVTVTQGGSDLSADFGYQGQGTVGDRVWIDINGDGVQDGGETAGLSGVTLWVDLDNNGVQDGGEPSGTTNASGIYSITGVPAGTWNVRIDPSSIPFGYGPTTATVQSVTVPTNGSDVTADFGYRGLSASIEVEKTVYQGLDSGASCPGSELVTAAPSTDVTFCFQITNTGSTYLNSLTLDDTGLGINLASLTLLSGTFPLAPAATAVYYYESSIGGDQSSLASVSANPTNASGDDIIGLSDPTDSDGAGVSEGIPSTNPESVPVLSLPGLGIMTLLLSLFGWRNRRHQPNR